MEKLNTFWDRAGKDMMKLYDNSEKRILVDESGNLIQGRALTRRDFTSKGLSGTNDPAYRDRLLAEPISLENAINMGKLMEDNKQRKKAFKNEPQMVNRVRSAGKRVRETVCYCCGREGHESTSKSCPAQKCYLFQLVRTNE